jgi:hypothetical protein
MHSRAVQALLQFHMLPSLPRKGLDKVSKHTGMKKIKLIRRIRILEAQVEAERRRNVFLRIFLGSKQRDYGDE